MWRPRRVMNLLLCLTLFVVGRGASAQDITSNLVGHWRFNEGSGTTAFNSVSGGTNGTLVNGASYVTGKLGPFGVGVTAASSHHVTWGDLAAADVGTGNFTVALWVKGPFPNDSCLLAKDNFSGDGNGFYLYADMDGTLRYWNGSSNISWTTANDANWHHLVVVRTGTGSGQVSIYGDGTPITTGTDSRTLSNSLQLRLGACTTTNFTTGHFDDVRLYSRALTSGDVATLFNATEGLGSARLGLHVTQQELDIWRARRTNNTVGVNGATYQAIYQGRILSQADSFQGASHPGADGHWEGWTGPGCHDADLGPFPGRSNGRDLERSAFVFLLTGDAAYAAPVRTELLQQITEAGTDFSNSSLWCPWPTSRDGTAFGTAPWVNRLLFAYDYLLAGGYTGFSAAEKTSINAWFLDAGQFFMSIANDTITGNIMSGARDTPPDYTCDGGACPGGIFGLSAWGKYEVPHFSTLWHNRIGSAALLGTNIGVFLNDATLVRDGKLFVEESIRFASFDDGTHWEQSRWNDIGVEDYSQISWAWGHMSPAIGNLIGIADVVARTGDTSLYTYTSPGPTFGAGGSNVGLRQILVHTARMINNTIQEYASTIGTQTETTRLTWFNVADSSSYQSTDLAMMISNVYYKDGEIRTAVTRTLPLAENCEHSDYGCYNWPYATMPDTPFLFGNHDGGQINPYLPACP